MNRPMSIDEQLMKSAFLKNTRAIIASTATIVTTVLMMYFGLKSDIQDTSNKVDINMSKVQAGMSIQDLQIKTLQIRVDKLEFEMNQLKDDEFLKQKNK